MTTITDVNGKIFEGLELPKIEAAILYRHRRQGDPQLGHSTSRLRSRCQATVADADILPRWAAGANRAMVFLPLEFPHDGVARICRAGSQSPRHAWIWSPVERSDQRRLGWTSNARHPGLNRRDDGRSDDRSRTRGCDRCQLWRIHGLLVDGKRCESLLCDGRPLWCL